MQHTGLLSIAWGCVTPTVLIQTPNKAFGEMRSKMSLSSVVQVLELLGALPNEVRRLVQEALAREGRHGAASQGGVV